MKPLLSPVGTKQKRERSAALAALTAESMDSSVCNSSWPSMPVARPSRRDSLKRLWARWAREACFRAFSVAKRSSGFPTADARAEGGLPSGSQCEMRYGTTRPLGMRWPKRATGARGHAALVSVYSSSPRWTHSACCSTPGASPRRRPPPRRTNCESTVHRKTCLRAEAAFKCGSDAFSRAVLSRSSHDANIGWRCCPRQPATMAVARSAGTKSTWASEASRTRRQALTRRR